VELLKQDIKFAIRSLRRHLGFASIAVLTLALGIGATTSIFSVVNGVMLKSLPYPESDQLVRLWTTNQEAGVQNGQFGVRDVLDFREQSESFEAFVGFYPYDATFTDVEGNAFKAPAELVSYALFDMLRVKPFMGRFFTADDAQPGQQQQLVLAYSVWQTYFNGDPDLIGKTITAEGGAITVIGIAPPGFDFPKNTVAWAQMTEPPTVNRRGRFFDMVGRLKPGVSLERAEADMSLIMSRLADEYPDTNRGLGIRMMSYQAAVVGDLSTILWVLLGAAAVLLLVACANVANLLLARGAARSTEIAVRTALGAGRTRITRQLLTESLVMAGVSAVAGVGIAFGVVKAVHVLSPPEMDLLQKAAVDGTVLWFALGTTFVTGILFGFAPAMRLGNPDLRNALSEGGKRSGGTGAAARIRSALVAAELAMAVVLVVSAGLLVKSFSGLTKTNPGFNESGVLVFELALPIVTYREWPGIADFYTELIDRLEALPGVQSAVGTATMPFGPQVDFRFPFVVNGRPAPLPGAEPQAYYRVVTPGFFKEMGIPMVAGREFDDTDRRDGRKVAGVNEAFAKMIYPDEDPLDKRISGIPPAVGPLGRLPAPEVELIGVVSDVKYTSLADPAEPAIYFVHDQAPFRRMTMALRTAGDPLSLVGAVRSEIAAIDRSLAMGNTETLQRIVAASFARERFGMLLLSAFGFVALVLASVGIYGVISFGVQQRTPELAVRVAIGATPGKVVMLVLQQGGRLAAIGITVGLVLALAAGQLTASVLFGVTPYDPATYASVTVALAVVAMVATLVPAWRATKIQPAIALKPE
jgi:putative ABC transport system permease protein